MMPAMTKLRFLFAALVAVLVSAPAGSAAAEPVLGGPATPLEIGRATIGTSAGGRPVLLLPVTYPIEMNGRKAGLRVRLRDHDGRGAATLVTGDKLSAGKLRRPDRRDRFTYVHLLEPWYLDKTSLSRDLGVWARVRAGLDVDRDGKPEAQWRDRTVHDLAQKAKRPLCSTVHKPWVEPGRRTFVPLPACTSPRRWRIVRPPASGSARIEEGSIAYRPDPGFRGTDSLVLSGGQHVRLTVGSAEGKVVRALGDSVTAGFGYYASGEEMGISQLYGCRPAEKEFNDACSSNSVDEKSEPGPVEYATDYGLAKNVSWAAQWANEYGVTDYKNFAISGSEPGNWAPGGAFYKTTRQIESEDPDYVLLTLGANPMLSNMLTNPKQLWCAFAATLPEFEACIRNEFARVELRKNLKNAYTDLVQRTTATIYVMRYHLSIPWSAVADSSTEIALAGKLLNEEIASVAAEVGSSRLQVVTPPHFNVGIDVSPVYPSAYTCRFYPVDGPSVQSTGTQDEFEGLHPLSFCEGPAGGGAPWVINGDTGIHPSAAGYEQMASQVPPPS
jgi:lysophospholipase L1-like esterase